MSSASENVAVISHLFISILPCGVARGKTLLPKTIARSRERTRNARVSSVPIRTVFQVRPFLDRAARV
jgi:hypothetical protein